MELINRIGFKIIFLFRIIKLVQQYRKYGRIYKDANHKYELEGGEKDGTVYNSTKAARGGPLCTNC